MTILSCVLSTASYFLWLFHEVNDFNEFVSAMFYIFGSLVVTVGFLVLVWKMKPWFRFIDNLEIFLNKSELIKNKNKK